MKISFPRPSLVVLIGTSGAGKTTFANSHFRVSEVVSSDFFRGRVRDHPNDQSATHDAFLVLHSVARKRLAAGLLTVVDATNLDAKALRPLRTMARRYDVPLVAIALDVPEEEIRERNRTRSDRHLEPRVLASQRRGFERLIRRLPRAGFDYSQVLTPDDVQDLVIEYLPARGAGPSGLQAGVG